MNSDWQAFLLGQQAVLQDGVVQHFNAPASEPIATQNDIILCDLSQFATLRASGADAQSFLQNLLSNDIREVSSTHAQISSFNTAKGRVLATMLIWRDGEDYLLQLPHTLAETIRKKLSMYILRAKVKITDASNESVSLGLSGVNAQEILRDQFGGLPEQPLDIINISPSSVLKIGTARFQINTTVQHATTLWKILSQRAQPVGSACWDWLNIRAGIPIILPQTQEQFVPQMVNLDLIGGINFKKGCYPGQEIVARTQYLGKLKRRMFLAHVDSREPPQPGDELFSADMEGQTSGMIVNATPAPSGGHDVLVSIQTGSRETQIIHWKSLQGRALEFLPLPYSLPES